MIFNSISYLFFLPIVAFAYYLFPGRLRWMWLLFASIIYYLSFIPVFAFLLSALILINYFLALKLSVISDEKNSRFLALVILLNLVVLALFKYFNIIFPHCQSSFFGVGLFSGSDTVNKMILPLGLSYLIFTILSYQIELKRKTIKPEKHLGYFSLYLFFFPKIAQGPIERPGQLLPQLHHDKTFNSEVITEGLKMILWGYFKKLVVADRLAIYVNAVYNNSDKHNGTSLIIATIFFAFQIYADFSGYTDIALGSAKLFGINLTNNFRRPYFATSIKDFWDRWHISFSGWLRDYLFLPLAYFLSHKMIKQKYLGISSDKLIYLIVSIITFAICGIWHGVGWNYLIWGVLFGIYLTYANWSRDMNRSIRKRLHISKKSGYYLIWETAITFVLVSFCWIFFRAGSLGEAIKIILTVFASSGPVFYSSPYELIYSLLAIIMLLAVDFKQEFSNAVHPVFYSRFQSVRIMYIVILVLIILLLGVFDGGQFIYFQF